MPRLVLAENTPYLSSGTVYGNREALINDNYLKIPNNRGGIDIVREDILDHLPDDVYEQVMDEIEPYNTDAVSGIFSKWRERRKEKRETRQQNKIEKIQARAAGRADVAKAGGGIGGALKNIVGAITGNGGQDTAIYPDMSPQQRGQFDVSYTTGKPFWQNPWVIGGAAAVGLGLIYLATRKSK